MINKVLLVGFQKTGSSWVRFVIFNYLNILKNKATKTLTWDELEAIHTNKESNPQFTHLAHDGQGIFKKFDFPEYDKLVYLMRNPWDTMISYWHWMVDRDIPWNGAFPKENLEDFTKRILPKYLHHIKITKPKADLVLYYDELWTIPIRFWKFIDLLLGEVNEDILRKSIEISSIENIRKMTAIEGQPYGGLYRGNFCRDGSLEQYNKVMSNELIDYIKNEMRKLNNGR